MPQLRTFIDSGVLLAAFKAVGELAENALAVLGDAERQFVSSDFVRLELLPKPICYGNDAERLFYETFFANVEPLVQASALLVEAAEREAEAVGLSAMDALHIAAAYLLAVRKRRGAENKDRSIRLSTPARCRPKDEFPKANVVRTSVTANK